MERLRYATYITLSVHWTVYQTQAAGVTPRVDRNLHNKYIGDGRKHKDIL